MLQRHHQLICILDRSGSMEPITGDAKGGFNAFVDGRKHTAGSTPVTSRAFLKMTEMVSEQRRRRAKGGGGRRVPVNACFAFGHFGAYCLPWRSECGTIMRCSTYCRSGRKVGGEDGCSVAGAACGWIA